MEIQENETFGGTVRQARMRQGLSMQQVADHLGMSKSLLRFWEIDQIASPDLTKVERAADLLELDPIELARLAGYDTTITLPPMQPYLRSKYPDLPEAALKEINAITTRYGVDPNGRGPAPGEDES